MIAIKKLQLSFSLQRVCSLSRAPIQIGSIHGRFAQSSSIFGAFLSLSLSLPAYTHIYDLQYWSDHLFFFLFIIFYIAIFNHWKISSSIHWRRISVVDLFLFRVLSHLVSKTLGQYSLNSLRYRPVYCVFNFLLCFNLCFTETALVCFLNACWNWTIVYINWTCVCVYICMSNLMRDGDEELGMHKRKRTQEYHRFSDYFCHFCYKSIMKSTPQTELHYNRLLFWFFFSFLFSLWLMRILILELLGNKS